MTMDGMQKTVGSHNAFLGEVSRHQNASPPLPKAMRKRDEILRLGEEERMRTDFYRSAVAAHKARTKKLDEATVMLLEDLVSFNKQVHESSLKSEKARANYDVNLKANWRLSQRIEIIRSLCCKLNLYAIVMKTNLSLYEEVIVNFLRDVAKEMRLDTTSMVVDRHTTLQFMYQELCQEYNKKATELKELKEERAAYVSHMDEEIMILLNQMGSEQDRLKHIKNEVVHREGELTHLLSQASSSTVDIYRVKTAIYSLLTNLQAFRGDDAEPMEAMEALEFIQYHFLNLNYAVAKVRSVAQMTPKERKTKAMSGRKKRRSKSPRKRSIRSTSRKERRAFDSEMSFSDQVQRRNTSFLLPEIRENATSNATDDDHQGGSRSRPRLSLPHSVEQRATTKCCRLGLPNVSINSRLTL